MFTILERRFAPEIEVASLCSVPSPNRNVPNKKVTVTIPVITGKLPTGMTWFENMFKFRIIQ